ASWLPMLASNCSKMATSEWQAPAPAIFSRTSPGPGFGRSTSSIVGNVFQAVKRTAFMVCLLHEQRRRACTAPRNGAELVLRIGTPTAERDPRPGGSHHLPRVPQVCVLLQTALSDGRLR